MRGHLSRTAPLRPPSRLLNLARLLGGTLSTNLDGPILNGFRSSEFCALVVEYFIILFVRFVVFPHA
eukprot:scaffold1353_cov161-Amphora_coffeaeformis.AAC.37